MGLFSSKKKYVVNVTVQPIFEEKMIPDSVKAGILKGIVSEGDINEYMLEEVAQSIGIRANVGYAWAKKNDYAPGIPTSHIVSNVSARNAVMSTIAAIEGGPVTRVYYRFGPMNSLHYGWNWLVNTHGYNTQTNELVGLSASTGFKCYLKDMRATYTKESYDFILETYDNGMLDQLGPSPQSGFTPSNPFTYMGNNGIGEYAPQPAYEVSTTAVEDYVTITYEFEDAAGNIIQRGLTLPIEGLAEQGDYHQVRYTRASGKDAFFTYLNGANIYPSIDAIYDMDPNTLGTFYPWMYFRVQDQKVDERNMEAIYKSCKGWSKYIGVNFDTMSDAIHEDPDVDDVAQVILQLGVRPDDQDPHVIEYLFKHFTVLHQNALDQEQIADNLEEKFQAFSSSPSQIQYIQDNLFAQTLQFSGIHKKRVAGSIGKVGTYTSTYGSVSQDAVNFVSINPQGVQPIASQAMTQPGYVYRYQTMDSMYEELVVYGLRIDYKVHYKKGFGAGAGQPELLVPVDRGIMKSISVGKREKIVCKSMHMLVNTVQVIKTKWYQSGVFKWIMIIVAVVITIFSMGSAWQTIVAAAAIGTTALVITLVSMLINVLIINYAIKLFVKKFGPKIGIIAAVAAMAYGAYSGFGAASGGTNTWGESLLAIGNGLAKQSMTAMQKNVEDVMDDIVDYESWAKGQFDSLKDQRDQLGLNPQFMGLEALDLIQLVPDTIFGEAPQDYYSRTVHSGNIGATSYDLIEFYHYFALELPKINDIEGTFNNGELLPES